MKPAKSSSTPTDGAAGHDNALREIVPDRPSSTEPPIGPGDPMIVLAYRCLRRSFESLRQHRPEPRQTPSSDDVHQMRIATRRLRVAIRLFGAMLPRQARTIAEELRWFARALGNVRDLDVYAQAFRDYLRTATADDAQRLGGYELHVRRDRASARAELKELFSSERYANLMRELAAILDGAPTAGALRRWQSFKVRNAAAKYLKRSRKRVLKLGGRIGQHTRPEDLHRLRIRAKRLRYELEFFLEPCPQLGEAVKATKALQDVLGAYQDAFTAQQRLADYRRSAHGKHREHAIAPAVLAPWQAHHVQQAEASRQALPAEWQRFASVLKSLSVG